jgi:hypothetical protein
MQKDPKKREYVVMFIGSQPDVVLKAHRVEYNTMIDGCNGGVSFFSEDECVANFPSHGLAGWYLKENDAGRSRPGVA